MVICWGFNLIDFVMTLTYYLGLIMLMIIAYSDVMSIINFNQSCIIGMVSYVHYKLPRIVKCT